MWPLKVTDVLGPANLAPMGLGFQDVKISDFQLRKTPSSWILGQSSFVVL